MVCLFPELVWCYSGSPVGWSLASHVAHYRSLFPQASEEDVVKAECLNDTITAAEVRTAMKLMQDGKAAGVDGLPAEVFTHAFPSDDADMHVLLPEITHAFNRLFEGDYPQDWATCAIVPVLKPKGDARVKDDYGRIAIGTALSKLYSMVLMAPMDAWAEREGRRGRFSQM